MKSICYVIPYFGKLPKGFGMWLLSCKANPTINWILYTDDKTEYHYPENVKVKYCTFEQIQVQIQNTFDFPVVVNRPWKLCEYKPAYGEIFADDLENYDFWGHCDMDLIWGDIRKFITEEILDKYEKIGFQGHSVLYKNTEIVNKRYQTRIDGVLDYKTAFTNTDGYCFDETGMCDIYDALGIPYYRETNFAHLDRFTTSFFLLYLPEEDNYKNNRQIFVWEKGSLYRYYLNPETNEIGKDEFMYLHLFSRPISFVPHVYDEKKVYVIYPDVVKEFPKENLTTRFVKKKGTCSIIHFYLKVAYFYRHKLTIRKIIYNFLKKIKLASTRGFH